MTESTVSTGPGHVAVDATPSPTRRVVNRFRVMRLPCAALLIIVILAALAAAAPWIAPFDPNEQDLRNRFAELSWTHPLGTDDVGRDTLSRLVWGTRISLFAPFIALGVAVVVGLPMGMVAGYVQGRLDWLLSRIADALLSLPGIILAIAIVAALGPSTVNAMLAVGVAYAPRLFRVARAGAMVASNQTFVEAAHAGGCSRPRTLFTHVLPNALPPVIVQASLLLGFAMLAEASLSFLGIGVQPPSASWGVLLRRGFVNLENTPALSISSGISISIVVMAYQFIGDGLRDALGKEIRRV